MSKHYLSVCAIFRNEARYLREFIEFHRIVGVEHFFLYDNLSEDDWEPVLAPYMVSGIVDLISWPVEPGQLSAYGHALEFFGNQTEWMAFIDIDEFLFSPTGKAVPEMLADYECYGGVGVNWAMFGTGGFRMAPPPPVTAHFRMRADDADGRNLHIKSIVRPVVTLPQPPADPHHFSFYEGAFAVDENGNRLHGPFTERVSFERLRINHYYSKSYEEAQAKVQLRRSDNGALRQLESMTDPKLNAVSDSSIMMYAGLLRRRLAG